MNGTRSLPRPRPLARLLAVAACTAIWLAGACPARANNVLLIWDIAGVDTQNLKSALEAAGMTVTLSATNQTSWDDTNPSTTGFCTVVHLNGTTFGQGMPAAGQSALVSFVQNGGGYIGGEWNAFDHDIVGIRSIMRDLILFDRVSGNEAPLTYSDVPAEAGHPILANVPSTFSFTAGFNVGPAHTFGVDPVTVLMTDQDGSAAVGVRDFGLGRVVNFNHAGNYNGFAALSNANVQQLYVDAVRFTCGCGNGTLDAGEECDDGNSTNGDGCSSTCAVEPCLPPCNDGIACTDDRCVEGSPAGTFVCTHLPLDSACDDDNACTDDLCDLAAGCTSTPDDTNACEDEDACSAGDHCVGGACVDGEPLDCNDFNPCTDDACNSASGCFVTFNTNPCNDGNSCTTNDRCSFGGCFGTPTPGPCSDGNPCTANDACSGSFCVSGTPVDCNDGNPCTTEFCAPFVGCRFTVLDGPACDDGSPCTTDDACQTGACVGEPRNCFDDDACTVDSCDSAGGAFLCEHRDCNTVSGSSCPAQCSPPSCGNGVVDPGETCDPPDPTIDPLRFQERCRIDCTRCGDGQVQGGHGESCDDGNLLSGCDPLRPVLPLDACQNACTGPICHDPSTIRFLPGLDVFNMHGRIAPTAANATIDPMGKAIVVELTDGSGSVVFRASLEPGLLQQKGVSYSYANRDAETAGGFSKVKIRARQGSYVVTVRAYGDLSGAGETMTTHIYVDADEWTLDGRWSKTARGWRLIDPRRTP